MPSSAKAAARGLTAPFVARALIAVCTSAIRLSTKWTYSFLRCVDALAQRRRQRMVLVQHDRDLAIARTEHDFDVQADQGTQALFGIGDARGPERARVPG